MVRPVLSQRTGACCLGASALIVLTACAGTNRDSAVNPTITARFEATASALQTARPMLTATPVPVRQTVVPAAPPAPTLIPTPSPVSVLDQDRALQQRDPAVILSDVKASLTTPPNSSQRPKVGGQAHLWMGFANYVVVGSDHHALVELSRAVRANDTYGLHELITNGTIHLVTSGTAVLILTFLSGEDDAFRVRVTEGALEGKIAY